VSSPQRFRIRYGALRWLLSVLGTGPRFSNVDVKEDTIHVSMGWAFQSTIPLSSVTRADPDRNMWGGLGVHGWRGRWLVNGSVSGIVTLEIQPPARAWVIGFPVRLRKLHISLEDPDGFLAAVGRS
jgi:hypothetical protein